MRDVQNLAGLPVDVCSMGQATARVIASAEEKTPLFISTPNANFLMQSFKDASFRRSVIASDLSLIDGMPLVLLSRMLGARDAVRVAGSDLFLALDAQCQSAGRRLNVFFFGGRDGAAQAAHKRYQTAETGIRSVGYHNPGFGTIAEMSTPTIRQTINDAGADFIIVALGAKKGQDWIMHNRAHLTPPVLCHLGAVVDFAAGTVAKAPPWISRIGMEWAWRIGQEPSLWKRYFFDAFGLAGAFIGNGLPALFEAPPPSDSQATYRLENAPNGSVNLHLTGAFARKNTQTLYKAFADLPPNSQSVSINGAGVTHFDPFAQGTLLLLARDFLKENKSLQLIGFDKMLMKSLNRNKLIDSLACNTEQL